jgi:TusA-related sulfurtransferase
MGESPHRMVDCIGLYCPMPIVRTREALREMSPGQTLELVADDPAVEVDMLTWSARSGHPILRTTRDGAVYRFLVRKAR